jgi:hypothetical protein
MGSRYADAYQQIREILAARSQSEPLLEAKEVWDELTCWPIPSIRTIRRQMEAIRSDMAAAAKNLKARSDSVELGFSKEFYYMAAEDKLDTILNHLETLHSKHDGLKATCDSLVTRVDTLEAQREKQKSDADAKEKEEKEKADAASRKADAVKDPHVFADAQLRADAAYQAWGKQASHALAGESVRDFRIRLLSGLKQHSKRYRDSDLTTVGDETVFNDIERVILDDAVKASNEPGDATGVLRKVTSRDDMGRITTKFYGDPLVCWAPFMGGGTRLGKFGNGRPPAH